MSQVDDPEFAQQYPEKAYKNLDFLNGPEARPIRILCEYEEPRQRLRQHQVSDTVVFFGSARTRPTEDVVPLVEAARAAAEKDPEDAIARRTLHQAEQALRLARYYDDARELARRITAWSMEQRHPYVICSGGGPGIMEAANRGAADVPGGRSVGLGISLPFEQGVNPWVSEDLAFEFHYFFTRKYWFLYLCRALVIFPGGFGTLDELFETLTLVQTNKIKNRLPIVLYGSEYWDNVLNLSTMVDFGTISPEDLELVHRIDTIDEAFACLTTELTRDD